MTPLNHRRIPDLPDRPRISPTAGQVHRSYTAGRQHFSRAIKDVPVDMTVTTTNPIPETLTAHLRIMRHVAEDSLATEEQFKVIGEKTLQAEVVFKEPGLYSFRSEYSVDRGATWLQDSVPDAWTLVDPPLVDGLRLYTMIPKVSGTITDWIADLKRIADMGFNTIHLLPVTTQDTSKSPYSAKDLFSVDPSYLDKDRGDYISQMDQFVSAASTHKLQLCFDLVLNHVGVDSLIAKKAPEWIVPDQNQPDGLMRARYWSGDGWHNWDDLVLINYEHPTESVRSEIWSYMTDYALFWANYASQCGGIVRLDNLHGSDPNFMKALSVSLRTEYPEVALLAEYFTDEQTILNTVPDWGLNLLLATPWEHKFVPELREHLRYIQRVSGQIRYFTPITSHDSGSPAQEFGSPDSTIPRYIAAALMGTGATGIVQGVEYGVQSKVEFIGPTAKADFPPIARFGDFIHRVNAILTNNSAFRTGNCTFVDNAHDGIIAGFRKDSDTDSLGFLVASNFDIHSHQNITIDLTQYLDEKGPFVTNEMLTGDILHFPTPIIYLDLAPCSAVVLQFSKSATTHD